jgi:hypothetical protein
MEAMAVTGNTAPARPCARGISASMHVKEVAP